LPGTHGVVWQIGVPSNARKAEIDLHNLNLYAIQYNIGCKKLGPNFAWNTRSCVANRSA